MENQFMVSVEINATAVPPPADTNRVYIGIRHFTEEFLQDPSGIRTPIVSYLASPAQFISLSLRSSSRHHISQLLGYHIQNPELCQRLASDIAPVATWIGLGRQVFFMFVQVTVTEERLFSVSGPPSRGAPEDVMQRLVQDRTVSFRNSKNRNLESEATCTICLEEFLDSDSLIDMPCSHMFHDHCILEWLNFQNSCPLCRRLPYEEDVTE